MFRSLTAGVLIDAVGTSAYYRGRARLHSEVISRRREGVFVLAMRLVGAALFLFPVIGYVAVPQWMTWASFDLPVWSRWCGVVLGVVTIPSIAWVLGSLGDNVSETVLTKTEHRLVMTGPYRWVRHPLYTTGIVLFLAIGLMQASWLVLAVAVAAALSIALLVIPAEERALVAKFGDEYRTYTSRTGGLLPRAGAASASSDEAT